MRISDWSSDVCSSDLQDVGRDRLAQRLDAVRRGIAVMSVAQRLAGGLDDMLGRLEVRLADAEVDDVPPLGRQRRGSGKDLEGGLGSEAGQVFGEAQIGHGGNSRVVSWPLYAGRRRCPQRACLTRGRGGGT